MTIIIEIKTIEFKDLDIDKIAEFTFNILQSWDVTKCEDRTLKDVVKYIEVIRDYKVTFLSE